MQLILLKSKIHRVTTTKTELDYEGSCEIDKNLLEASNIKEYEQIHIYNIKNGNRFITYAIEGEAGSGVIALKGAAAHKADVGDLLIIATYANYDEEEVKSHRPIRCYVDETNTLTSVD